MAIAHTVVLALAAEGFDKVKALASSSRPGCRLARKHLAEARAHGLDERAYIVRDGMCYGWSGNAGLGPRSPVRVPTVEPMFGFG